MAATSTTETWDAAWTLTMRAKRKRLTDNIFDSYPTLAAFKSSGLEIESGGKEFQEDLMYGKNTGSWFDGDDTLPTDAVDGITAAFFPVRYIAVPITISFTEEQENKKSDAAQRLLAAKTEQSMLTARDTMNAAIYSAQSGKSMLGFQDIIADTPTSGTVGGINRATNTWWRNKSDATSTDADSISNNLSALVVRMTSLWDEVSEGNESPQFIFTTPTVSQAYRNVLSSTGYARTELNSSASQGVAKTGGVGEGNSTPFYGAKVIADRDCASGKMYMVNTRFLKLKMLSGVNFTKTAFKENANQMAKVGFIVVGCNLTANNCRRQGVVTTIT